MGYREELISLMQKWTEDKIDISDNWNEWEEFLTAQGYIKTYNQVYEMDLDYLISNKEMAFWDEENDKWDVELLIKTDNDITKMSNECYFVHRQQYIDESDIDLFYEQQEAKAKQERLNYAIAQAYKDLDKSFNAFSRFDALLFIFGHDFGNEIIHFASDMKKVRKELLKCFQEVLIEINKMEEYKASMDKNYAPLYLNLWLPNHITSNEEDEHYCELIKFGGYEILEDGQKILQSDAILLINDDGIQTLEYFTYQNINHLCSYIADTFESYKEDCYNVDEATKNNELNDIINKYWMNTIEFDYAEFYKNH